MGTELAYKYKKNKIRPWITILALAVFLSILFCASVASTAPIDITLAWDASSGADGYRLFYREDGQSYNYSSPDWEGTGTSGTIYGLDDLTTYHFVVRAYNSEGESGNSNEETYTPASSDPAISLSTTSLSRTITEGSNAQSQTFTVRNTGGGTLNYSISDNSNWLSVSPSSGTSTGEQDTITVSYATSGLSAGSYSATITVTDTNASNSPQTISVSLAVNAQVSPPSISLSTTSLSLTITEGSDAQSQTFTVRNTGGVTLNYSISDNSNWLAVSPSSGTSTGEQDTITVSYATSGLSAGSYSATINITDTNASNSPQTISVSLTVNSQPQSNLPPNQPIISSPYQGEVETDLLLTVQTEPFSDPDGDAHKETQWQIVKTSDSSVVLEIVSSEHLTSIPVPHAVLDRNTTYNVSAQFVDANSEPSPWSDPVEFTTHNGVEDYDGDGIPDNSEVDDTVDLNEDGMPDNYQPDVIKSALSAVAGKKPLGINKITASIDSIEVLEPIHPSEILDKKNKPKNFLYGLAAYRLRLNQVGGTVNVKVYYSEDISGAKGFYLYDTVNGWRDYTQYTTFNTDGRSVTVELKDGGQGDSDGVANGIIVDPGGVVGAASTGGLDSGAGGGCFVATAKHTEQNGWLKPIVRVILMPLVGISYVLMKASLATTILLGFMLVISVLSLSALIYKRRKYQV